MDWWTSLFAIGMHERKQRKEQKKRNEKIAVHRAELIDGIFKLEEVLNDLYYTNTLAMEQEDLDDLQELAPLLPMAEILSLQGYIGAEQQCFLRDHLNLKRPRYNLGQFTDIAIKRAEGYSQWYELAELDNGHCGRIWHTLIEEICRQRVPEVMQQVVDHVGAILYHFWFLENEDMTPAQLRYQNFISSINIFAESDQQEPYLHAVMLLQNEMANRYGGTAKDYTPWLDEDEVCDMDGKEGYKFSVHKTGDYGFIHFCAVRKREKRGDPDLIWELPAGGGAPIVILSEDE